MIWISRVLFVAACLALALFLILALLAGLNDIGAR
jgi:hypothetical protein